MVDEIAIFTEDGIEWFMEINNRLVINQNFSNPYEAYIFYQKNSFNLRFQEKEMKEKCIE
jgi:hypothetical protein